MKDPGVNIDQGQFIQDFRPGWKADGTQGVVGLLTISYEFYIVKFGLWGIL